MISDLHMELFLYIHKLVMRQGLRKNTLMGYSLTLTNVVLVKTTTLPGPYLTLEDSC